MIIFKDNHKAFKPLNILRIMFRHIMNYFKKPEEEPPQVRQIELSKIDKYVNLILRHSLSSNNKAISDALQEIESKKESIMQQLRQFHKKSLMNPNIPQREIQIMDGNRDNFIKTISQFTASIDIPKNYMELYDYSLSFSEKIEAAYKSTQKNVFVLSHFFGNEIKSINTDLNKIEELIMKIRALFEKHKIALLKEIINDVKKILENMLKIRNIEHEITEHTLTINDYAEKIKKLQERINTITAGTDYRALESFKSDKQKVADEIKKTFNPLEEKLISIDQALRKYLYRNPDKKILKEYLDERYKAFMKDDALEISQILTSLKEQVMDESIELKDKKKDQTIECINSLDFSTLKDTQSQLNKLEDSRQHLQTKITHNSASLNLSEQQYWINTNTEKIQDHKKIIEKMNNEVLKIKGINEEIKRQMKENIEKLFMEDIRLIDDLAEDHQA